MNNPAHPKFWRLRVKKCPPLALILLGVTLFKLTLGLGLIPLLDDAPEKAAYSVIAKNLLTGDRYVIQPGGEPVFHRPPTYTFFLVGLYYLFGDSVVTVTLAHILLDLITCLIIYRIAHELFGQIVALGAVLGVGFYPLALYYDTRQMTEALFTVLLAGLIYFLIKGNQSLAKKDFFLAGIIWGLGTLCKTSLMYFAFPALGITILSRTHKKQAIWPVVSFFVAGIMVISPWTIRNYVASGGHIVLVSTAAPYTLWFGAFYPTLGLDDDGLEGEKLALFEKTRQEIAGNDDWLSPANQNKFTRAALDNIRNSPLQFTELVGRRLFRFWFFIQNPERQGLIPFLVLLQLFYLVPGGVGLYYALRERAHHKAVWLLLAVIMYYVVLHALTMAEVRYSVPIMPYVIIFSSYGVVRLMTEFGLQSKRQLEYKRV